jgi:2-oxoisovalerate dehydrogenase E2 component (dihydrolipoyl transacylase)
MGEHVIKLPDVGEGVAEAELVEWHVKIGDLVREDTVLAAVMTDKATVEIPAPVDGEVLWLGAEVGDTVAIGSPIVRLKVAGEGNVKEGDAPSETAQASAKDTPTPNPLPSRGGEQPNAAPKSALAASAPTTGAKSSESPPPEGRG